MGCTVVWYDMVLSHAFLVTVVLAVWVTAALLEAGDPHRSFLIHVHDIFTVYPEHAVLV
jgi:hypothetical protein